MTGKNNENWNITWINNEGWTVWSKMMRVLVSFNLLVRIESRIARYYENMWGGVMNHGMVLIDFYFVWIQ